MSPDEDFRSNPGASVVVGSWTVEMNRLKKLFSNPRSSFVIDLLAYWNNEIFPHDKPAPPYQYRPPLDDQQREYDDLLIDVELASVKSDVQSGLSSDEEGEHLAYEAYKSQRYASLSSDESTSDTQESGEGDGSDDGEQEFNSGGGEEGGSEVYESRGSE